jgi:DNA-binding transcriptional MerR regulator
MSTLTISQLARRSGVPATTLRYYEKVGVMPAASRSDSGYRLYDEAALARVAFIQRAKALGVELDDLADLVRLWDGDECAPVQERLRELVHAKRSTTRQRLEELTRLAADLDGVAATIGDAACGPDCACVAPAAATEVAELPIAPERLIGAACTLNSEEMRERLAEWRGLRDRAVSIQPILGGARLALADSEPVAAVADLVARESECCSFYTFTLQIDGPTRQLAISAGTGGESAVRALIGIEQ